MHAYVFQAIQSPIVSENPWKLAEEADKVGGPWMPVSSPLSGAPAEGATETEAAVLSNWALSQQGLL